MRALLSRPLTRTISHSHNNAIAESIFQLLKRERIKEKTDGTREEARSDTVECIEMFNYCQRWHG